MVSMYKKVVGVVVFYFQASKRWNGIRVLDDINASSKTFWLPRVHQPKNLWGGITEYTDIINTVPDLSAQTTFCKAQRKRSIKRLYRESAMNQSFYPRIFVGFWIEFGHEKNNTTVSDETCTVWMQSKNTSSTTKLQL